MIRAARIGVWLCLPGFLVPFAFAANDHALSDTDVTPIQKVIQMLNELLAKGKQAKHVEEVEFAAFHEWCDQVRAEKTKNIKDGAAQINQLSADIAKAASDAATLSEEIVDLEAEIVRMEGEAKDAMEVRGREHADYLAEHKDYSESISAIVRAAQVLKTRTADVPQSLMQVRDSRLVPTHTKALIESFLSLHIGAAAAEAGPPEANAYEFQSGGVITMLDKLKLKFQDQLLVLEKEELNAKANYEVLLQQLTDDIKASKASVAKKTSMKAGRLQDGATAKGDKHVTEATKAEDETTLSDTLAQCRATSKEYEKNQVVRAGEIKAIQEATRILSSNSVAGHGSTYLPAAALLEVRPTALAQLRSSMQETPELKRRLVQFLQSRALSLGSRYLSIMAVHAAEDPFKKVKKMIKDLIIKLMEQANAEADHHAYCETELATNKQTREIKSSEADELTSQIDLKTAESEKLASEIQALSDAVAAIRAEQHEATKIRGEQKATNAKTIADAKEAQSAVGQAMKVLKDFYTQAATVSMLQGGNGIGEQMAQAAQEPYQGMQDLKGGVIGMLEVVLSDFARLETETQSAEDQESSAHEKFMAESNEDIAVKDTEMKHLENKRQQCEETLSALKKDLALTQEELDAALDYYAKLKADCVDKDLSYADRKRMREEEIQSLQEALKVLDGQDLA